MQLLLTDLRQNVDFDASVSHCSGDLAMHRIHQ